MWRAGFSDRTADGRPGVCLSRGFPEAKHRQTAQCIAASRRRQPQVLSAFVCSEEVELNFRLSRAPLDSIVKR